MLKVCFEFHKCQTSANILKEEMEKAATLQVPIIADIRISEVMDK